MAEGIPTNVVEAYAKGGAMCVIKRLVSIESVPVRGLGPILAFGEKNIQVGDYVVSPFEDIQVEPAVYRIESVGRKVVQRVNPTTRTRIGHSTLREPHEVRSYRFLDLKGMDAVTDVVNGLRRQRSRVLDTILRLPLMADV